MFRVIYSTSFIEILNFVQMIRALTTITKVIFPLLVLVSPTGFLQAQAPVITCPGAAVTYGDQSNNDAQLWNAVTWWDPIVGSHDLAENKAPLFVNITDACTTGTLKVKYILYLDLDNNGSLETRVDSDTLPAANTIHYNNIGLAVTAGEQQPFDARPVAVADKYRFDLQLDAISPTEQKAQLIWRSSPTATTMAQLPYGTHKMKWVVTNDCGQQSTCEYTFTIRDEKPPTVVCINGLSVNLMNINDGSIQLWASDFLLYTEDNYSQGNKIAIGIRKLGTGTGFPYDATGTPQTGVVFDCNELGTNLVELWSKDSAGNGAFCETYILIQDNAYFCSDSSIVGGRITTDLNKGIAFVQIEGIDYFANGFPLVGSPSQTNSEGYFNISNSLLKININGMITPTLELNPLNGVNTWDLILIGRHISAGITPLDTPFKIISADANKSGTIDITDIIQIRKLILGVFTRLPANSSWLFFDKDHLFSNPFNPFADVLPQHINIDSISYPFDFIGTKIGDVNLTAVPSGFSAPLEDLKDKTLFTFQDQNLQENEEITLRFAAESAIEGYQMTLDLAQFEVLEILPQGSLTMDNFGQFDSVLTMATERPNQRFDLKLRAKQAGQLSSMIAVSNQITYSVAFGANGTYKGIALDFIPIQKEAMQLNQNVPNPWRTSTNIGFYLPEANTAATFTVVDEIGRVIYTSTDVYTEGYHAIVLDESVVAHAGIYWYSLTTTQGQLVQKMIKI
jgi:hypothetical protein